MPIYEYNCENCGVIQILKPIKDPEPQRCTKCGGKITRKFSSVTPIWKCDGAYTGRNHKE